MSFNIVFMGTPEFSVPALNELIAHGHTISAVYTQPPRKSGRGMKLTKTPVHTAAERYNIPVITRKSIKNSEACQELAEFNPDVLVVVAFGLILPQAILDTPPLGAYNIHASLLPRWRGAAPIHRAILAGDEATGVTIMKMDAGLDTGPMALQQRCPITQTTTTGELHDTLSHMGADLMVRALSALSRDALNLTQQPNEGITYAEKIDKSEARIDWSQSAKDIDQKIRGLNPVPGAFCLYKTDTQNDQRLKILNASRIETNEQKTGWDQDTGIYVTHEGGVRPEWVQPSGKPKMSFEDFLNGIRNKHELMLY